MKTLNEITNAIAKQLGKIAYGDDENAGIAQDYTIIVCPERIFADDYLEQRNERLNTNESQIPYLGEDIPNDTYYSKTIFFVVKVGGGQRNMAVSNSDITIRALSEEDDFVIARQILEDFVIEYNFKYDAEEGIVQAYFNPEVVNAMDEVYTGFRALLNLRGFIRIPADGSMFINDVYADFGEGSTPFRIPFMNIHYSYSAQPDPQAFAGFGGLTKALNRQCTEVVTFSTYLKHYGESSDEEELACNAFTEAVLSSKTKLNRKFHLVVSFQNGITLVDDWFVLSGAEYGQQLADLDMWNLSFASAKESEDENA